ncbi:MAG: periplasmic heavy metal sensor [Ignavibacteriales bacterium]|nr:MAG: periplasmic heavy metal sensor [Ignavibacteriales bacterium]
MDWLTKQKTYVWLIIILVIINLTTLVLLWMDRPSPLKRQSPGMRGTDTFLKTELGLTEEQDKQLRESRDKFFGLTRTLNDSIGTLKREIQKEGLSGKYDSIRVDALISDIGKLQSRLEKYAFDHFSELAKFLKPDQVTKFQKMFERNRKHPPGHKENHHNEPPPFGEPPPPI